jgi:hypothetical protein
VWDFLRWIVGKLTDEISVQLGTVLDNQQMILQQQVELRTILMGMKEDFAAFVQNVNQRTNELADALVDINDDITRLLDPQTPEATKAEADAITARLLSLAETAKAIAARDTPVVPPPVEPPPVEPPPVEPPL